MNYIKRLAKAQENAAPLFDVGGIVHVMVSHDDFCPMYHGGRLCVCKPDIAIATPNGKRYNVDMEGNLTLDKNKVAKHVN